MKDQRPFSERHKVLFTVMSIFFYLLHLIISPIVKLLGYIRGKFLHASWNRLHNKTIYYSNKEDYPSAISCCERIINSIPPEHRKVNDYYIRAVLNLGHFYCMTGNFVKSEELLKEGIELTEPDSFERNSNYINLGMLYTELEKFKLAEKYYLDAYRFFSNYKNSEYFENVTYNLYHLYLHYGQRDKAEQLQKETSLPLSK